MTNPPLHILNEEARRSKVPQQSKAPELEEVKVVKKTKRKTNKRAK